MRTAKIYGAIILSMIFWSFSYVWFKVANQTFRPITIIFCRIVLAVAFLSLYLFLTGKFVKIRKEDRKLFFLLALFEPFLYFIGESFGLTYVSATIGSVIISTIPVFVVIGSRIVYREKLKAVNYAGIIISFTGVLVFIIDKNGTLSFNIKGLALLMFAVFSAVGYTLVLNRLVGKYSPVFIVCIQNMIGAALFLPVFILSDLNHLLNTPFFFRHFIPVIELAVFASCGAFILFAYSVKHLGISRANVFSNCIPLFTACFSFIMLGDKLHVWNIVGMAIVIAGLFMSQINGKKKDTDDALILTGKTA
ncbi:MAG: DMT family transporter [Bacteroidales bacterium]|jgi:drug/metabolite transporter (DMT)-like permease